MARSGDPDDGGEVWGTWEELLLACAVNRHGTRRWDSVSMEIKSRSPASRLVSPQSCRLHFLDLRRRFGGGDDAGEDDSTHPDPPAEVPWLDELRKLRVAELRREVERYDVSIGSLQLKVKKLLEQRERRASQESDEGRSGDQEAKEEGKSAGSTPESLAGNRISSADPSGPSYEQSNSTDSKQKSGDDGRKSEAPTTGEEAETADPSSGGDEKVAERSYNGSTGSPAAADAAARSQATGESIAESNGGGEGTGEGEEGSDVQSSASLSRRRQRRQRRKTVAVGGGEEAEAEVEPDDPSVFNKRTAVKSKPLVVILEMIRSDKFGSVFERRLESQEGVAYQGTVRQHVDLEMVRAKLDGVGSERPYSPSEFFRDLLLLCSNAVVFYSRGSPETIAAAHLRRLVVKEMEAALGRPKEPTLPPSPSPPPQAPEPAITKPKPESDLTGALPDRPISSAPVIACRKRSSILNKAAVKEEKEEKPDPGRKDSDNEEKNPPKKTASERPVLSGTMRGLRTNKVRGGSGGAAAAKRSNLTPTPNLKSKAAEKAAAVEESPKAEKKNSASGAAASAAASTAKKQSATSFLNRMKRNSNGTLIEMLKNSSPTGVGGGRGKEQKKEVKADGRKGPNARQAAGGSAAKKKAASAAAAAETSGTTTKRSVGRPPKRAAAPPTPPTSKKAKEDGEAAPPPKTPASSSRKRGRR